MFAEEGLFYWFSLFCHKILNKLILKMSNLVEETVNTSRSHTPNLFTTPLGLKFMINKVLTNSTNLNINDFMEMLFINAL